MAAALQCEICGGKLVGKPGGIFECDSCGMEYSTEWAKQKIQEIRGTVKVEGTVEVTGKVQVEGGTVNVEGAATKESLLKRAKMCYADGDWEKAAELLEQVLNADPECGEAYLYRAAVNMKCKTLEELRKQYEDIYHDDVLRHPDVEKAFQFATGALKQMLLGWKQHRDSAAAADLARREENRLTFPALRCRTDKLSKMIIAGTYHHTVGLKADGTVVAVGENKYGQCNVNDWLDIVAICAGDDYTVGLKADGTVVAVGYNKDGQCNVNGWRDIVAISAGFRHTVGLKADGTVVAVGDNEAGQCNVNGWRDIVAISAGDDHTVGLKADGTVVAEGWNAFGQCNVSGWRDIVAISAGDSYTVGLKADGTVVAVGWNTYGQRNVNGWRDIVAICAGDRHTVGLKADGTVVAVGDNGAGQCNVSGWRLFQSVDTLEEEREEARKRQEQERKRQEQERARHIAQLQQQREAERKHQEQEKARRIAQLQQQRADVQSELANLKGLFTGMRRREIEAQLAEIDSKLKALNQRG